MRPDWDDYFIEMTNVVKKRSTCLRRQVGALIVKNRHILATGYNGVPPSGIRHCSETGCLREQLNIPSGQRHEICRGGLHAEQNAIVQAAFHGVSINGSVLYCNTKPCSICARMICNSGITKVIYVDDYDDPLAEEMFYEKRIQLIKYEKGTF